MLATLEKSVVYVTSETIESLLMNHDYDSAMTSAPSAPATAMPVARAADLDPRPPEQSWLIDGLWRHHR